MSKITLTTGITTNSQIPVNGKNYFLTRNEAADLGNNDILAYSYYDKMVIIIQEDGSKWQWREEKTPGEAGGLISQSFSYPNYVVSNGVDYSNKTFNFFEYDISINSSNIANNSSDISDIESKIDFITVDGSGNINMSKIISIDDNLNVAGNMNSTGYKSSGNSTDGDLVIELGDYDNAYTGAKLTIDIDAEQIIASGEMVASAYILSGANYDSYLQVGGNTASRTYTFPDATGTVALTSDIEDSSVLPTSNSVQTITGTTSAASISADVNVVYSDSSSSVALTIETTTNVAMIEIINNGTSGMTIDAGTGVTILLSYGAIGSGGSGKLIKVSNNNWVFNAYSIASGA